MNHQHPMKLKIIFNNASSLAQIKQKFFILNTLNYAMLSLLPKPLCQFCSVVNYRQGVLVIGTSNAHWRLSLYYEKSRLISSLRQKIVPQLVTIQFIVIPCINLSATHNFSVMQNSFWASKKIPTVKSAEQLTLLAQHCHKSLHDKLLKIAALITKQYTNNKL